MKFRSLFSVLFAVLVSIVTVSTVEAAQIRSSPAPSGALYIVSSMSDQESVWDQPGYPKQYQRGAQLSMYLRDAEPDQQFYFEPDGDGWYHIRTVNGQGAVTIEGNKDKDGARLVIWDYDRSAANQKFLVQHQSGGHYKIFTSYGRCVTVANRSAAKGSAVLTWGDHEGKWMTWRFRMVNGGKYYNPENNAGSSDGNAKKYGTLKDAISGTKIGEQYFTRVSAADFESENSGKIFQSWANGLSRNDQLGVYSDVLANSINSPAAVSIFKALSEVNFKPGKGFVDGVGNNALRKQYTDAAGRQKNAAVRAQLEAVAAKIK